ncbi:glycoside hydrolase family 78 protein [Chitinophaga japonensis]|uniref:alpha-L-rhamnosidase n=1 Tax=Chitinophaga japonensis TaxID=104662 RepID=A0A562SL22_CHIJA|nr:glycoside hydrolase family 78 protein [Chitinophaga japonensis]TWI82011.1 alpha-L-rhamnosidase [Chitinophaga japonensis]
MLKRIILLFLSAVLFFACGPSGKDPALARLRCEFRENPLGIDITQPRLSWEIQSSDRGVVQQAYQVLVASTREALDNDEGDLWNSDKVMSDQSVNVRYAGKPLGSGTDCYWKVKVWTADGLESGWSQPAYWSTGLLQPGDWQAKWIGLDSAFAWERPDDPYTRLAARYFRKEFQPEKKIKKATAYISGLGLYELYINGNKIGDQVLAPGPTEYNKRVFYNTFDVTDQLQEGSNAIGVILGNGRYFHMRAPGKIRLPQVTHYGYPKMICQVNITYEDGSTASIVSDNSWKVTANGPIVANNEYDGEAYDATKEMPGWSQPGFNAATWLPVQLVEKPGELLVAQLNRNIKVMDTVKAVSVKEIKPGLFIYDMGQNFVGWVHLKVKGAKGDTVKLRFAERLQDDSTLYMDNLRSARVTDVYTLKGDGTEEWEPRFTYHGFRYVEVTGYPGKPDLSAIEGRVVYDDMETTGEFTTSNKVINQVYKNAYWGIRGNYRGMPTDCPQRDERMGWLGDRAVGARGESFIFNNHLLYAKWLQDIEDAQSPEGSVPDVAPTYWKIYSDNMTWPAAYLIIANLLYEQYGDDQPIRKHYASMKKWMQYMKDKYMKDYILTKDTYGDWCMPPESPELIHSKDPARKTAGDFLGTAFYYHLLTLMERFATLTGNTADVAAFRELGANVKTAFNNKFLDKQGGYYANNTPTANIFSLAYGLTPADREDTVFHHIVNKTLNDYKGHISTGLVGAEWLMRVLTGYGRGDIAYQLATNTTYPSWGYMAEHGATTIWELWNGNTADPAMNSGNHVMLLGDLVVWYYENLAGIKPDPAAPGFKKIIMKPLQVKGLDKVEASYRSVYGPIRSAWEKQDGTFNWHITIPANTSATVYVPAASEQQVKEGNAAISGENGVKFLKMDGGYAVYEVGSGEYSFSAT